MVAGLLQRLWVQPPPAHPFRPRADPPGLVARMADLCGVDRERLRLWVFARCVVEWLWFDVDGVVESLAPWKGHPDGVTCRSWLATERNITHS